MCGPFWQRSPSFLSVTFTLLPFSGFTLTHQPHEVYSVGRSTYSSKVGEEGLFYAALRAPCEPQSSARPERDYTRLFAFFRVNFFDRLTKVFFVFYWPDQAKKVSTILSYNLPVAILVVRESFPFLLSVLTADQIDTLK